MDTLRELKQEIKLLDANSRELEKYILPSTLMDCFELHRDEQIQKAAARFTPQFQSHLLAMMNEFRGWEDRKEGFDLLFDPSLYFMHHSAAWEAAPSRTISLPPLNTQVVSRLPADSPLVILAEEEMSRFSVLSDTYMDDDLIGLASIAAAGYGDTHAGAMDRRSSIRYVAINASSRIEDMWAMSEYVWVHTPDRIVELPDVTGSMKARMLADTAAFCASPLTAVDLTCYSEQEVRLFAFSPPKFLLSGKTKHMALCGLCQEKIARLVEQARMTEQQLRAERGGQLPQA